MDRGLSMTDKSTKTLVLHVEDAYETIEEMYGMIWYLAAGDASRVELARRNYQEGLRLSPGTQPQGESEPDE
jgi:hypothetical protein